MNDAEKKRKCVVCQTLELDATQLQTCVPCLGRVRQWMTEIVDDIAFLPDELVDHAGASSPPGSAIGSDSDGVADALVLMAGGMNGGVKPSKAGDREHAKDSWPSDVSSVVGVLCFWEDDWRSTRKLQAAREEATVTGCANFLNDNLTWAAQHHTAFDAFADDIRQLRGQVKVARRDQGVVDRGKRLRCDKCHEPFVRYYRKGEVCKHDGPHCDHSHPNPIKWSCRGSNTCGCDQGGRKDEWECSGCGQVIDDASYWLRVKEMLENRKAS